MGGSPDSLLLVAGLLLAAKAAGGLAQRFGMPSVLGILAAGLLAGPSVLGIAHEDLFAANLGQLGVILLMFLAGLYARARYKRTLMPERRDGAAGPSLPARLPQMPAASSGSAGRDRRRTRPVSPGCAV